MTRIVPCPGCNRVVPGITPGWFCWPCAAKKLDEVLRPAPRKRVLVGESWAVRVQSQLDGKEYWSGRVTAVAERHERTLFGTRHAAVADFDNWLPSAWHCSVVRVRTFEVKR